jgi:hypothetical protein
MRQIPGAIEHFAINVNERAEPYNIVNQPTQNGASGRWPSIVSGLYINLLSELNTRTVYLCNE